MELRVLEYYLMVCQEGSISKASEKLYVTQPTLSRQLKDLENELGVTLFTRGRTITLTDAGRLFYKRAEEIVTLSKKAKAEVKPKKRSLHGTLRIGAGETEATRLLYTAFNRLRSKNPDIVLAINSGDMQDILYRLDDGVFDFALLCMMPSGSKYNILRLPYEDHMAVLLRKDSPLAKKPYLTREDIAQEKLIVSRQQLENGTLEGMLQTEKHKLSIVGTFNLIYNGALMVEEGMGMVLTYDGLFNTEGTSLLYLPFKPEVNMVNTFVYPKNALLSPLAQAYLKTITKLLSEQ